MKKPTSLVNNSGDCQAVVLPPYLITTCIGDLHASSPGQVFGYADDAALRQSVSGRKITSTFPTTCGLFVIFLFALD